MGSSTNYYLKKYEKPSEDLNIVWKY